LSDHAQLPGELQREVQAVVKQTQIRSGWPVRQVLRHLEIAPATYYRWPKRTSKTAPRTSAGSLYEVLPSERNAILDYALQHPEVRHRELAWKMVDEGVCGVSSSTVYRVLGQADLVCRWSPRGKSKGGKPDAPTRPNQRWETDLRYVKVGGRNYYLLNFLDVYSRYVVHHELLRWMDGRSVSLAAAEALATLSPDQRPALDPAADHRGPVIQSDNGACFIAREFAATLAEHGVSHSLIRPHTPTDNAHVERYHRTIGEKIDERIEAEEIESLDPARSAIRSIIDDYNHRRLHSSLNYLRPVDYYRGHPESLLAERRRKLQAARTLRKQENLKLRQRLLPYPDPQTVPCSNRRSVSL
jgi:transposase InsO family protein